MATIGKVTVSIVPVIDTEIVEMMRSAHLRMAKDMGDLLDRLYEINEKREGGDDDDAQRTT